VACSRVDFTFTFIHIDTHTHTHKYIHSDFLYNYTMNFYYTKKNSASYYQIFTYVFM